MQGTSTKSIIGLVLSTVFASLIVVRLALPDGPLDELQQEHNSTMVAAGAALIG